jgi:Ni,Fe-hydrogenase III large subunit
MLKQERKKEKENSLNKIEYINRKFQTTYEGLLSGPKFSTKIDETAEVQCSRPSVLKI